MYSARLKIIFFCCFFISQLPFSAAAQKYDSVKSFNEIYQLLQSSDAFTRQIVFLKVDSLSSNKKMVLLEKLWDKAQKKHDDSNSTVQANIFYFITEKKIINQLPGSLFTKLRAPLRDRSLIVRKAQVNFYTISDSSINRNKLLLFLNDPDEDIRVLVLVEVKKWGNAIDVLTAYIKNNQRDKKRGNSVAVAEKFLKRFK